MTIAFDLGRKATKQTNKTTYVAQLVMCLTADTCRIADPGVASSMFHSCLYYTIVSVPCSLVITCWERADLLALLCMMFPYVLSLSQMVSRVRCGT